MSLAVIWSKQHQQRCSPACRSRMRLPRCRLQRRPPSLLSRRVPCHDRLSGCRHSSRYVTVADAAIACQISPVMLPLCPKFFRHVSSRAVISPPLRRRHARLFSSAPPPACTTFMFSIHLTLFVTGYFCASLISTYAAGGASAAVSQSCRQTPRVAVAAVTRRMC